MSFIKVSMAVMALAAVLAGNATARDDGRYSGSPLKPWFDTLRSAKGLCCSVADGFVVAVMPRQGEQADANARLIAAAPDLLEALKGLFETGAPEGISLTADEMRQRFEAARAAIAKAEGR